MTANAFHISLLPVGILFTISTLTHMNPLKRKKESKPIKGKEQETKGPIGTSDFKKVEEY
jgi:hypothetical protein